MASTLKKLMASSIGITETHMTVDNDNTTNTPASAPAKVWNIPRLYVTNITTSAIKVRVRVMNSGGTIVSALVYDKSVAANDTLVLENIFLTNGWKIMVKSDTATSLDAFGSVIEEDA